MFKLQLETDPKWAHIAEENLEEILTDHAWCEQKAASNAITLITLLYDYPDIVAELESIAIEELEHFQQVHEIITKKGFTLGAPRKDDYVNELYHCIIKGGSREAHIVDKLLFAAMVEARSCERFKVLSDQLQDKELAHFYFELMKSEANHYTTFLQFAKTYSQNIDVNARWKEWLEMEGKIIRTYGTDEKIHG